MFKKILFYLQVLTVIFYLVIPRSVSAAVPDCLHQPDWAPQFLKFDPKPQIQPGQKIQAIFTPPQNRNPTGYQVSWVVIVGNYTTTNFVDNGNGQWTVDLGNNVLPGVRTMEWRMKVVQGNDQNVSKCGQSTFEVCDAQKGCKSGTGVQGDNPCKGGICKTAIGDIPTNPQGFVTRFLTIAIGLGGGIAFILMVIGAIRVLTSSGDQQKLSGGRDQLVAAIAGLLFIIFSTVILRFIGIGVLGL